jgi:hypothetical protein
MKGIFCALMTLGMFPSLWAQSSTTVDMSRTKIVKELVDAPSAGAFKGVRGETGKWFMVLFDYNLEGQDAFLDEIQFKVYIEATQFAGKDDKEGKGVVLTGEVTYINIPLGSGTTTRNGVFFVHPNTVERFGGAREFENTKRNIHVDAFIQGQKAGSADFKEESDANWFISPNLKAISGLVYHHENSPWLLAAPGIMPAVKQRGGGN